MVLQIVYISIFTLLFTVINLSKTNKQERRKFGLTAALCAVLLTVCAMFLTPVTVRYAAASDPASWDLLNQPWDSTTGWTKAGSGTSDISPTSQLRHIPDNGTYVERYRDIGTLPEAGYTLEASMCVDSFGTSDAYAAFDLYDGLHAVGIYINATAVRSRDGQPINLTTNTSEWYTWRFVIDSDAHLVDVYRNATFVGNLTSLYDYTSNDGWVSIFLQNRLAGQGGAQTHIDYTKIATGLYRP